MENGETVKVPMMTIESENFKYGYARDLNTYVLELPYKGLELSMVILLPGGGNDVGKLGKALTADDLMNPQRFYSSRVHDVIVYLPRFKLKDRFNAASTLSKMGMVDAFGGRADFSGMTGSKGLRIGKVVHQSFIEVNEEGSEAAAATAVVMGESGGLGGPPVFRADRPFLFYILHKESKSVLFFGKFSKPADKALPEE